MSDSPPLRRRPAGTSSRPSAPQDPASQPAGPGSDDLLARLERCAAQCAEVERVLGARNLPELETIIKLHRLLILRFSLEAESSPELLKIVEALMKPVMDWARLEEKRKEREFAEQRASRDLQPAPQPVESDQPLQPGTLEKIQEELSLL